MAKGRQKGQTKIMSKIKDEVISPYELWLEEDQIVLMDTNKNKAMGYYGSLEASIRRISQLSLVSEQKDYTLAGFIESYNNITIPDAGQEKPEMGKVLAVGPGRISTNGNLIPNKIKTGVTVMVPKFGAQTAVVENETYIIASENDVLGIIRY